MTGSLTARRGRDKLKGTDPKVAHRIKHTCTHATDRPYTVNGRHVPRCCKKEAINQDWVRTQTAALAGRALVISTAEMERAH